MSIENPTNYPPQENEQEKPEEQRMGLEKAQEEAKMIRAEMGIDLEKRKMTKEPSYRNKKEYVSMGDEKREPTSEDYEIALNTLEELQKLAEEKPELLKKIAQYAAASLFGATLPFELLGQAIIRISKNLPFMSSEKKEGIEGFKEGIKDTFASYKMINEQIFSDAR